MRKPSETAESVCRWLFVRLIVVEGLEEVKQGETWRSDWAVLAAERFQVAIL